eukprot:CAMPEP_0168582838 /NCGR_PEP_ID=MMETSP0420-20121227/2207_1 /TAXON_ID=498008 /ORGANISM="Pessonella sp." /LENGTH=134 /DNA_ID=CAMNT_0008617375 /DNA_START=225 /DNA_END=626 /DNA_ORIENTATION=+
MTLEDSNVIVNAANTSLDHASGLAGAIVRKGGDEIQDDSDKYIQENGRLDVGQAIIADGHGLPAKYVIHVAGPTWKGGEEGEELLLQVAVRASLDLAENHSCQSISLPAISSGIFGVPKTVCAKVMFDTVIQFL